MKCKECKSFIIYDKKLGMVCSNPKCKTLYSNEEWEQWKNSYNMRNKQKNKHEYKIYKTLNNEFWCTEMNESDAIYRCYIETIAYDSPDYKFYYVKI